jgi:hypothetical protein
VIYLVSNNKIISGKCLNCALLSYLRKTFRSTEAREHIRLLHLFHRITYMHQRKEYASRINEAKISPASFRSSCQDGMCNQKTKIPLMARQYMVCYST